MTKWFVLATLAGAAACSGAADHVLGPTTYVVDGVWLFEETLADSNFGEFCSDHAHITLTQDGPRFTGFGRQVGACAGTAYGDKPDSVAGHTICQFRSNGQTIRLSGTWHLVAPPDSQP